MKGVVQSSPFAPTSQTDLLDVKRQAPWRHIVMLDNCGTQREMRLYIKRDDLKMGLLKTGSYIPP
jgi:hypothetical protein